MSWNYHRGGNPFTENLEQGVSSWQVPGYDLYYGNKYASDVKDGSAAILSTPGGSIKAWVWRFDPDSLEVASIVPSVAMHVDDSMYHSDAEAGASMAPAGQPSVGAGPAMITSTGQRESVVQEGGSEPSKAEYLLPALAAAVIVGVVLLEKSK